MMNNNNSALPSSYAPGVASGRVNKPKGRTVRLDIPQDAFPVSLSPPTPRLTPPSRVSPAFQGAMNYRTMNTKTYDPLSALTSEITITSPSVFYSFPEDTSPVFVYDIMTPSFNSFFQTTPPSSTESARFLIYLIVHTSSSPEQIRIVFNGQEIFHLMNDSTPLDVSNHMKPFGQSNNIVVESGSMTIPFTVVGVWSVYRPLQTIIADIQMRGTFPFNEIAAICPITGFQIEYPARGKYCEHDACFDGASYITASLSLGVWTCPICGRPIHLNDLVFGSTQSQQISEPINTNGYIMDFVPAKLDSSDFLGDADDFW